MTTPDDSKVAREAAVAELERRLQEMREALEQTRRKMGELDAAVKKLKERDGKP